MDEGVSREDESADQGPIEEEQSDNTGDLNTTSQSESIRETSDGEVSLSASDFDKLIFEALLMDETGTSDRDAYGRTFLHTFIQSYLSLESTERTEKYKKFAETLSVLSKRGLDINHQDNSRLTVLHTVVNLGRHPDIIKALLSCGAKVNQPDPNSQTALHKAVSRNYLENVEALLDGGADPNVRDRAKQTPLHIAAAVRHRTEMIEALLNAGAKVNIPDISRQTALHKAAKAGRVENALLLSKKGGGRPDIPDSSGQTPLHLAASHDLTGEILKILVRRGIDLNKQDYVYMETPLHKAIKHNMLENVRFLLAVGSNPNMKDVKQDTVLHKAVAKVHNLFVWKLLMVSGGDPNVLNGAYQSPMQRAIRVNNHAAQAMMKQYGTVI